jgi:mono/diheme cytochrome c family protein
MTPRRPFVIALAAAILLLAGCDVFVPRPLGEKLWRSRCAECHGIDGAGNTPRYMGNPYADLRDDSWKYGGGDRGSVETVVRDGVFGQMPAFDTLTAAEMRALLDYFFQLRGERT